MFSGIKRFLGNITVEERNGLITVEGVDALVMQRDIKRVFRTTKIGQYMFTKLGSTSFEFPSYFGPDLLFTLNELTQAKSTQVSVKTLTKIRDKLLEATWLKQTTEEPYSKLDMDKLSELIYKPKDYQQAFLEAFDKLTGQFNLNGYLMAAAAGAGKTFGSLATVHCLDVDRVIIFCPKNAVEEVWETTIQTVFKNKQTFWSSFQNRPYAGEKYLIVHYDFMVKFKDMARELSQVNTAVILDESHNFNSTQSARVDHFLEMVKEVDSRDVIWLSGTPIKALSIEAIPLLRCIDPLFTPDVEKRFRKIFAEDKSRAVEILNHRLGIVSFKVEKKELGLPEPIRKEIKVSIPNGKEYTLDSIKIVMQAFVEERGKYYKSRQKQDEAFFKECLTTFERTLDRGSQRAYDQYRNQLSAILKNAPNFSLIKDEMVACNRYELQVIMPQLPQALRSEWKSVRSIIKYVSLKIQGECLGRILGGLRIQAHIDMVKNFDFKPIVDSTDRKTVFFTSFTGVLESLQKILPNQNIGALFVYGKTNDNLKAIIDEFKTNEEAAVLVATYASLSTAVPLIMADTMILLDSPFRDYILQQTISRLHRLGQDRQVTVYSLVLDTGDDVNISTRSVDILKWSQEAIEKIIGIRSPFMITDNIESFSVALEGFHDEPLSSTQATPSFLDW